MTTLPVQYQELIRIETYDGDVYTIPVSQYDQFCKDRDENKRVQVEAYTSIATSSIKKTYRQQGTTIDAYVLEQSDASEREKLQVVIEMRKRQGHRVRDVADLIRLRELFEKDGII